MTAQGNGGRTTQWQLEPPLGEHSRAAALLARESVAQDSAHIGSPGRPVERISASQEDLKWVSGLSLAAHGICVATFRLEREP